MTVQTFKKGPDYIDAAWLAAASGAPCRNLDTFMMSTPAIGTSMAECPDAELLVIEGNRGLFDGADPQGSHSTAELAKQIGAPVVLVVNTTKTTRTIAAMVLGCRLLDPDLSIAGVILNLVGTARQEALIREAVEHDAGVPVLGAIRRIAGGSPLPGRHLGLVTFVEHPDRDAAIRTACEAVVGSVDLDRLLEAARNAPSIDLPTHEVPVFRAPVTIGYVTDPAFSFYYPENLHRLRAAGVSLVTVSPTHDTALPDELAGLYIGGGFPEVHAVELADNREFAASLGTRARGARSRGRDRVDRGMPVYAECGGLMYLAQELETEQGTFPMAGVLDLIIRQEARPHGHGYEVGVVDHENPFFAPGIELTGHEFHYSRVVSGSDLDRTTLRLNRGVGVGEGRDGIVKGNVWASYLHLHATATPSWCDGFLAAAIRHAEADMGQTAAWA